MCWYSESRKTIEKIYGDDADLFCDLLAAISPHIYFFTFPKRAITIVFAFCTADHNDLKYIFEIFYKFLLYIYLCR